MRLTWLADVLRDAGLRVVEVDGWETRGSATFNPVGMTWHATAGSKTATAQGEVNVILNGSESAPAPISQLMLFRDGTFYVCASGRCNHNKPGWDGPNKGLGNTDLLGLEMANNNRGEPWPAVQLDAARRGTAAIMRKLGADPMRRLAAHYEHQPYATRPAGEGSTKSDPYGVDMRLERPRVAALMTEDDGMATISQEDFDKRMTGWAKSAAGKEAIAHAVLGFDPGKNPKTSSIWPGVSDDTYPASPTANGTVAPGTALGTLLQRQDAQSQVLSALATRDVVDEAAVAKALVPLILAGLPATGAVTQATVEAALRNVFASLSK